MTPPKIPTWEGERLARLIDVRRLGQGEAKEFLELLVGVETTVRAQIARIVDDTSRTRQLAKLRDYEARLAATIEALHRRYERELRGVGVDLAEDSAVWTVESLNAVIGDEVMAAKWSKAAVKALTDNPWYNSMSLRAFWEVGGTKWREQLIGSVRAGILNGSGVDAIARDLKNVTNRHGREVEAAVRTAVMDYHNAGSRIAYEANSDVVVGIEWQAALDRVTCRTCGALDGLVWSTETKRPLGHSTAWRGHPPGPTHPNCRCDTLPVTRFTQANEEIRAGLSQYSGDTTYEQWLRDQPEDVQRGVIRNDKIWKLWKDKKTGLVNAIDESFDPLNWANFKARNKRKLKK